MITGNPDVVRFDLSGLGVEFTSKPVIFGGMAMEFYGLRKRGRDIDFFITDRDYQALARKYPRNKKDMWGDLGVLVGEFEMFRSVCRLDYDFFSQGAFEYDAFKVISFEKLFFMKAIAFRHQPELPKHARDFELVIDCCYDAFRNKEYAKNAEKHIKDYLAAPDGMIYNDEYSD